MIIEYNVECFERTLVVKCDNTYVEHEKEILRILDKAYDVWHSPEDIEDPEEREWVENDACCEEYMMSKLTEAYPELNECLWDSFYYGDDENEIEEDMENHQHYYKYNIEYLDEAIEQLEDISNQFETFEKLGNESYWIITDCIKELKERKEKSIEQALFTRYKCKFCNHSCWDVDNDIEEELWGHIQIHHPDIFEEVQNWETPYMIEECYKEE